RSSPTHRPEDQKNPSHPSCNAPSPPLTAPRRRPQLRPAHGQIPIAERAAPPNTCPSPRFRPLEVFGRRPPCAWKRSSWPASENLHIAGSPCTVYSTAQSPMTRLESRWWSSRTRGEGFLIVDQFLLCFAISNPIR